MSRPKRKLSDLLKQGNWVTTIALAIVGVAYLYFWFLPNRREIDHLQSELKSQRYIAAQNATVQLAHAECQRQIAETANFVQAWEHASPDEDEVAAILGQINETLTDIGCKTTSFVPREPIPMAHLKKLPLELAVQSDLASLFEALRQIEDLDAEIWVESLSIERPDRGNYLKSEASLVIFSEISESSD